MKPGFVVAGRFELVHLAGAGGMGSVWRAIDRVDGGAVAVKMLFAEHGPAVDRFDREARLLSEIRHAGIVRYIAHGIPPVGQPFLAMEWLEGETLAQRLQRGPLAIAESIEIVARVAAALGALHQRAVVHRDVKPANVLLVGGDVAKPKLLDFGVARIDSSTATQTGALVGTPAYMAPEQARGEAGVGPAADVFALGCVLYECVAGHAPFAAEHPIALLAKVLIDDPLPLRSTRSGVPAGLEAIVDQLLAKDPGQRPSNGEHVADLLRDLSLTGATSTVREPPRSLTRSEQRRLCVLLARPASAEEASDAATVTPDQASHALERIRGAVKPFAAGAHALANGSYLITLERSGVATDDAARAARCALAVRTQASDLHLALVLGRGDAVAPLRGGDVLDRAALVLDRARDCRGVAIDEATAALLGPRYLIVEDERGPELLGERLEAGAARTVLGKPSPFIGRDRELASLLALYEQSRDEAVASSALVIGPAGIGKSRLCQELLASIERAGERQLILYASGDPLSQSSPFAVVGAALRRAMGVLEGEPLADKRRKVLDRVAEVISDPLPVALFLGELTGANFDSADSVELEAARRDRVLLGDRLRGAWEAFLEAECARGPVVIALEDTHWADHASTSLIASALRSLRERPLCVVAFGRPDISAVHPRLWAAEGASEIRLGELPHRACKRLARALLGAAAPDSAVDRVVQQAAGNAFYLEELVRAVAAGRSDVLPDTVMAMLEARLEALEPGARRVLRAASVYGEVFWEGAVGALLELPPRSAELASALADLVDREAIAPRRGNGKFAGERELTFRHALLREAAYGMLADHDRRLGHRLAAAWLERAGEGDAMVIAEHHERGGEAALAARWYRTAMQRAYDASDAASVTSAAARALACGVQGEDLGRVRHAQAVVASWHGNSAEARSVIAEALPLLPSETPIWCDALAVDAGSALRTADYAGLSARAAWLCERLDAGPVPEELLGAAARIAEYLLLAGRTDEGGRLLERALAQASSVAMAPATRGRFLLSRATHALNEGNPAGALARYQEAGLAFEAAGDLRNLNTARANVAYASMQLGGYRQAVEGFRESVRLCSRLDILYGALIAQQNLGLALGHLGQLDEALAVECESLDGFVTRGNARLEGASRTYRARIHLWRAEPELAGQQARVACAGLDDVPPGRCYAEGVLAHALIAMGKPDEAVAITERTMSCLAEIGDLDEGEGFVRLARAEALVAAGRPREAAEACACARAVLLERAAKIHDEGWRRSFLESVPEHARTLELAARWCDDFSGN